MEKIGTLYVDAGIVMVGDPCYTLSDDASHRTEVAKSWDKFCEATGSEKVSAPFGKGTALVVSSGYGDGEYPVYVEWDGGRVARLIVDFIPEDEDEDEDEYEEDDE